jgi:hypothetical protein
MFVILYHVDHLQSHLNLLHSMSSPEIEEAKINYLLVAKKFGLDILKALLLNTSAKGLTTRRDYARAIVKRNMYADFPENLPLPGSPQRKQKSVADTSASSKELPK